MQKVVFNTGVQIFAKAVSVLTTLFTTILLTGYLGRDGFGSYMYLMTLIILFGSFADWGTATIGVREVSKRPQENLIGNIIIVRFLTSLLAVLSLIVFIYLPFNASQVVVKQSALWTALCVLFIAARASLTIIFQARLQMGKIALVEVVNAVLVLSLSWLGTVGGLSPTALIGVVSLASFLSLVLAYCLTVRLVKIEFTIDRKFIASYLRESLSMGIVLLVLTMVNKIDTVLLGIMKGNSAVGIYSLSYRVYDVLILGAAYFMNSLLPIISQNSNLEINKKKVSEIYQKAFVGLFFMASIMFVVVFLGAPLAIRILTQSRFAEFSQAVPTLRLLAVAAAFAYYNHLTGYTIVGLGRQRSYLGIALVALLFNFGANLVLIPSLSFFGSAGATIMTEALICLATTFLIYRLFGIKPSFRFTPFLFKKGLAAIKVYSPLASTAR